MKLSIRKAYFVLFLEDMKCFGAINEDLSKYSLTVARNSGRNSSQNEKFFVSDSAYSY